jgi:hypothetical protein
MKNNIYIDKLINILIEWIIDRTKDRLKNIYKVN